MKECQVKIYRKYRKSASYRSVLGTEKVLCRYRKSTRYRSVLGTGKVLGTEVS